MKAKEVKVFLKEDGTIIFLKKPEREGIEVLDLLEMCDLL